MPIPALIALVFIGLYRILDLFLILILSYAAASFWTAPVARGWTVATLFQVVNALFLAYVLLGLVSYLACRRRKRTIGPVVSYVFAAVMLGMLQFHFYGWAHFSYNWADLTGLSPAPFRMPPLRERWFTQWQQDAGDVMAKDEYGRTLLHYAPWSLRYVPGIPGWPLRDAPKANARDQFGRTALHYTAPILSGGWPFRPPGEPIAERLIAYGADVNARDRHGLTPLHYAVMKSHDCYGTTSPARVLIANGADVNARDNLGRTPLHYAVVFFSEYAARKEPDALQTRQSDFPPPSGDGARKRAVFQVPDSWRTKMLVEILVGAGADVHARDAHRRTPLYRARNKPTAMRLLQEKAPLERPIRNVPTSSSRGKAQAK